MPGPKGAPTAKRAKTPGAAWFCVRAQPKHEHIAAACLRQDAGIEVFLPRIRYKRPTRQGAAWVTEALFPNYLFARFELSASLRRVHHARGVRGVVHFGDRWPEVPEGAIAELQSMLGQSEVHSIEPEVAAGERVEVFSGAFQGLQAVVERVMPGKDRVAVLMEFLGRQTRVQVDRSLLAIEKQGRKFSL